MKIGSLCSGAGGLDLAVEQVFGAETVWHCEINEAASKVLERRWPGVPNHRDLTTTNWDAVEPVDILTGGYPCQPFSAAGQRKGTDDERHIWPDIREAIRRLRPRITFLENVAGHRSLGFDRVLGDLAEDGMHVRWTSVRASDVGSCHRRERLFILVTPDPNGWRREIGAQFNRYTTPHTAKRNPQRRHPDGRTGAEVELLPTPAVNDMGINKTVEWWDEWTARMKATAGNGNGHGNSLAIEMYRLAGTSDLLPTPRRSDGDGDGGANPLSTAERMDDVETRVIRLDGQWGKYAPAIARWEQINGPAPAPTEPNNKGNPRLNPAFSEWMMGWPAGWVTDIEGISRNDQLRIIGNGVVPQCAEAALRHLLSLELANA